jgi:hypothetical protein
MKATGARSLTADRQKSSQYPLVARESLFFDLSQFATVISTKPLPEEQDFNDLQ